jgi:hypothetical protein
MVQESKEGWYRATKELMNNLYAGMIPLWDMSKVRPAGSRKKTRGGRARGPEPLKDTYNTTVSQ